MKGCIKLLGAYIGDDVACAQALEAAMKKRDPFFDRLRAASKEVGYHVLTACAVPLLNYITRTHDPNVVRRR